MNLKPIWAALSTILPCVVSASEVNCDEAALAARQWVASCAKVGECFGSSVCNLWEAKFSTDGIKYYVAEFDQGGFVVLTSDTRCDPVIFYSARGTFPTDETHPLCVMLKTDGEGLAAGLASSQSSSAAAEESSGMTPENRWNRLLGRPQTSGSSSAAASTAVTASEIQVGPLVKTQWGQSTANAYTPGNGADVQRGYFILGCGATALSQIMYTMRWPQAYVAPFTCTKCTSGGLAGTTFTALGGTYPWDLMTTDGYPTGETREIMSRFMGDVGIAFCTQWHTNADGTTGGSVELWHGPMAVTNFFGYSNAEFYSNTNSPGSSAISPVGKIRKVMKSNLDAGLPVMIEIHGSGGHEVVGDGYAVKDDLFYTHINFGWTGISDGWYAPPNVGSYTSFSGILYNLFTNQLTGASIASGRILASGSPVSGARVYAYSGAALVGTATSNEKGIYALILPPGAYDIVARTATKVGRTCTTLTKCSGYSSKRWNASGYYSGKVLPPEGINCGNECDVDITLVTSSETKGELVVAGEPQAYQIGAKPLPYGSNVLTNGQTVTISAPADFDFLEATHRLVGRVIGYRVDSWDGGDWVEGTPVVGTSCTLTQSGSAKRRLVWLWETKPSVRLYGRDGVKLSADNVNFSSKLELIPSVGDSLTVYARRTDSTWFVWEGAPEGSVFSDVRKRQMTMTVSAGEEIVVSPAERALVIAAEPEEYYPTDTNLASIAYGESSVVVGASRTYTAPSFGATNLWFKLNGSTIKPYVTDGVRGCVAGYRLDTWADGEWQLGSVTNASRSCSYTQTSDSTNRLVWIWNAEARLDIECQNAKVTADVNGGAAAQSQSVWVPCGTPAVINLHYLDSSAASVAYDWSIDGGLPPTNARIQLGVSDSRAQGFLTPVEGHAIVISIPPSYALTVQSEPDYKLDGLPFTGVTNVMNGVDLLKAPEGVYTDPSSGRHYRVMGYVLRRVYGLFSTKTTNDVECTGRVCSQFVPQAGNSSAYSLIWKWFEVNAQGELVYVPYMITYDSEKVGYILSTVQSTSIVPLFSDSSILSNATMVVRAVPADGYRYETAPEGWTKDGVSIVREYAADVPMIVVSIPDPVKIPPAPPMPYDVYEQTNLVAMWDCSTNLTSSGWTDTSGRYTFAWSDPTLVDIASNGVKFLDVGGYGYLGGFDTARTFGAANAHGYSTIELVFEEGTTDSQYFFESNSKKSLAYTVVSGNTPGFSGCIGRGIKTATNVDMTSGRNTVTVKYVGDSYKNPTNILINAHAGVSSLYPVTVSGNPFNGTYLGKGSATTVSATNMWCRSRISAIRIYSHHLTSEQIAANREIDQNRVFPPLPSPEPPPATVITVAFALGQGVLSAQYALGSASAIAVTNNQSVGFEENATFTVSAAADSNNWYRITDGTGEYVADKEKTVSITASAETPENPTPADYGLKGPFAESSSEEVKKVMGWAKTNGRTSAEMSALDFTTPSVTEKAYLFNVADDAKAVEAAEKAFAFTAIEPGTVPEPQTLVTPNGTVETQGANALAPANWEAPATRSHHFYRAILKK